MPLRSRAALVGALLVVLALAGCSSATVPPAATTSSAPPAPPLSSVKVLGDPRSYEGPSTAKLADAAPTPVASDPAPALPVTVTSHDPNGEVQQTVSTAKRIVAVDVSGSIAGTVYGLGLGSRLIGRDTATTLPGTAKLPLVTSKDGQSINAESVIALAPDVILTDGTVGPIDVVQQLRDAGIAVVFVKNEASFAGAEELARQVGAALGVPEVGEKLAATIASQVTAETAAVAAIAPTAPADKLRMAFLYLRGGSGIYYLFGTGSGSDQLISALGGIDAAASVHWKGMRPMTDEAMVTMDPDLLLVMTDGLASVGGVDGLLAAQPAIGLTSAGKHRRIVDMADGDILSFGPRSAAIVDALARAIYAPAS